MNPKVMKSLQFRFFVGLFGAILTAAPLAAQLTAAQDAPVAMGHYHLNISDLEAHRHFWGDLLGGEAKTLGDMTYYSFPNVLVFLRETAPSDSSIGSAVNHIGFQVPSVKKLLPKLKAAGVPVVTQREVTGGRAKEDIFHSPSQDIDLAFVMGPDEIKVELLDNPNQTIPIAHHHTHFAYPDVKAAQEWYAQNFGAEAMVRGPFQAADLPGVNLTFSPQDDPAPTKGRVLDHVGFEIENLEAFCKKLEAAGVKFDIPYRRVDRLGLDIAFFTDPWGVYVELTEGLDKF